MRLKVYSTAVLLLLLATSCVPSPNELQARTVVEESVVGIFRSLPHPQILPEYNSFQLGGLYHSLAATIHAKYWTSISAKKVCDSFLEALNKKLGFETVHSHRGECLSRPYKDMVFHSINGKKDGGRIWIDFSATEKTIDNNQMTEINIWLTHTLSIGKWRECVANDSGEVKSFCHSHWNRPLESVNAFLSNN